MTHWLIKIYGKQIFIESFTSFMWDLRSKMLTLNIIPSRSKTSVSSSLRILHLNRILILMLYIVISWLLTKECDPTGLHSLITDWIKILARYAIKIKKRRWKNPYDLNREFLFGIKNQNWNALGGLIIVTRHHLWDRDYAQRNFITPVQKRPGQTFELTSIYMLIY